MRAHPKWHLNPKVNIFHYFFAKKSYLIRAIKSKLAMGIICIYGPILLYLHFFNPFAQICEIGWYTFSKLYKNERTPHHYECKKSNRMKYGCHTKWVSSHLVMIRHETNMTKISLVSPISAIDLRLTFLQYRLSS